MTSDWTPGDEGLAGAVTAYLDTAAESFWHEAERIARAHLYPLRLPHLRLLRIPRDGRHPSLRRMPQGRLRAGPLRQLPRLPAGRHGRSVTASE